MSKLRVHELAKELEKTNKEILDLLKSKNIDVKSHMSSLEDENITMIRANYKKREAKPVQEAKPIQEVKTVTEKKSVTETKPVIETKSVTETKPVTETKATTEEKAAAEEKPKKKSNIIQVFRPQNASNTGDRPRPVQQHQTTNSRPVTARPDGTAAPRPDGSAPRPTGNGAPRPYNNGPRPDGSAPRTYNNGPRPDGSAPRPYNNGPRPAGSGAPRPYNNGPRPDGSAPRTYNNGPRPAGSGAPRPYNNGPRPDGSAPRTYNNGPRPAGSGAPRPYNNGPRPDGSAPRTYNNGPRPAGSGAPRPYNNGPRPDGSAPRPYNNGPRTYNNGPRPDGSTPRPYNNGPRTYNNGPRPEGGGAPRPYNNGPRPYNNGPRPAGGPQRPYGNSQNDRNAKPVEPRIETADKDSRKVNRDNKKKDIRREEHLTQGSGLGRRPNQGGGRRPNQRLPKSLQRPMAPKPEVVKEVIKEISLPEKMMIRELAEKMKMQPSVIVKKLFLEGIMVTVNHEIDFEKAQEIALEYDIIAEPEVKVDVIEELLKEEEEDESLLVARPPVVCVMGHVDHGKTSLLDAIRKTHVTDREAGGITQHIGAYVVTINKQKITFLDTPGHEAFTSMRMRGANATDIAILVVAADDGVMPQTIEAISHAKAAGIEIIVAINKIDKPSANVERVKQELSEYELIPEDWGGSTIFVPVSAHTGDGIDALLEMILLTAEVSELKANVERKARGLVIEAELDKGKGPVATILVQKGTLHVGDFIAAGACSGKVRAMMDDKGRRVKEAGPSTPVEILGLGDVPNAGEILVATDNDKEAKSFAATFVSEGKNKLLDDTKARMSLDDLFTQIQAGNVKELPIIVKADVQGSVEAVKQSLVKLSNEEVVVKVIHGGVGAINESDVILASASNAIIIGFNVRPDATAKQTAEHEGVDLRLYRVIYQAIEDVEAAMKGMLDPVFEEKIIGHAEIRQTFKASGIGTIAGSYVLDGYFTRGAKVRITRDGEQIFEGALASLKRFKDDVKEVKSGFECGLVFEEYNDEQEADQVEAYIMVEVPR